MTSSPSQLALPARLQTVGADVGPDRAASLLRQNFSWTLAGNLIYSGSQWCMTVVLARLAGPEGVGLYALAVALTTPSSR